MENINNKQLIEVETMWKEELTEGVLKVKLKRVGLSLRLGDSRKGDVRELVSWNLAEFHQLLCHLQGTHAGIFSCALPLPSIAQP
jgi:hypothetical protein